MSDIGALQPSRCHCCGGRDLACPRCQPENWASRWRAQRLLSYRAAVAALNRELAARNDETSE